ncbi:MAG: laccase domain-containing protein, partial [Hungatella sp.]
EVGEEVAETFRQAFSPEDWDQLLMKKPDGKYQLDLWHANERILLESGVLSEHIQTTDICTHCNPDFLFSHRTMGNERGNLAAFLCLKASGE